MEPNGFACNVWKALRGLLPKIRNHHGIHPFEVKQQRNLSSSKWCSINYAVNVLAPPYPTPPVQAHTALDKKFIRK